MLLFVNEIWTIFHIHNSTENEKKKIENEIDIDSLV